MSLADDLQNLESHPQYLSATPEQRTGILDKWKDAAANNYSAGDPSLKAALADEAEALLSANQARTRARLTPDITGKFPPIVPSWGEVLANPALAELPPEKKASISAQWRKDKSEQLLQMRPSEVEARAFLVDSHMADRTVAGEQPDVDVLAGDLSDRLRNAVQVYAEKPVAKTGEFFRDADGFNVHPSAALGTWEEYAAKIDAQDATPEEKIKARAMYGVSRDAAINAVLKNTAAVEEAAGTGVGTMSILGDRYAGMTPGTSRILKRPGKPDVPYEEFDQAAITQERIARYQSQGGSAEPLLSSDKDTRTAAEKTLLAQLSQHVLPEIDPALAARVSANPESPEAQALVTGFRDNLRARLWVAPADVKDDFEKARVLTNGESVWNSGWVAQASPDEVKAAAASTGLKGDALKAAEERGLQQRIDAAQDIVDAIVTVKDGAMIEGPGFRPMPADFREHVAKRAGSDDYKNGKINAADILNEWKQESGIVNAGFNAASGSLPHYLQSINLAATGALTSVLQSMGAEVPALSQWVDDNNTLLNEVQQLSAASETSRGQRIAGQIGKEIPFLLAGIGIGKLTEAGVRRGLTRAMASATAPEVLAAQGVAGVARSVALGERALASAAELANGTSSALRGYVGLQAARSGTDMYTGAYTKIKENALAQGYSEQSAQEMARSGAILPAIAGTMVTAGLMKLMPGGTEALVAKFGESATVAKLREKVGVDALKKMITAGSPVRAGMLGAAKTVFTSFGRHALDESVEEGVDEFLQSAITAGYDKTMTLPKMLEAAYDAALVGGIMGGASGIATNSFEGIQRVRAARQADIDSKREKVKRDAKLDEVISRMEGNPESQAAVEELATEVAARKAALEEEAFQIQGFTRASEDDAGAGQYVSEFFETPEAANQFIKEVSDRIGAAPAKGKHPLALFEFLVAEPSPGQFQVIAAPKEEAATEEVKPVTSPEQDAKLAPLLADLEKATSEFFADIRGVAATPAELAQRPSVARLREKYAAEIAAKSEKAEAILTRIDGITKQIREDKTPLTSRGKKKAATETAEKEAPTPAAEELDGLDISDDDKAAGLEETLTDYRAIREAIENSYVDPSSRPAVEGKEKDVSGQKQYEQNIRANRARFRKLAEAERALRRIDASGEMEDTPERAEANAAVAKAVESIKNTAKEKAIASVPAVKAALDKLKSPGARAQEKSANRDMLPEYTGFPENVSDDIITDVRALYKKLRSIANKVDGDAARIAAKDRLQKLLDNPPGSSPAKEGAAESNAGFVDALDELRGSKQFKGAIAADTGLTESVDALRKKLVPGRPKAAKRAAPAPKASEKPKRPPGRPVKVQPDPASPPVETATVEVPAIVVGNTTETKKLINKFKERGVIPGDVAAKITQSVTRNESTAVWWNFLSLDAQDLITDELSAIVTRGAAEAAQRKAYADIEALNASDDPQIKAFREWYRGLFASRAVVPPKLSTIMSRGLTHVAAAVDRVQATITANKAGMPYADFVPSAITNTEGPLVSATTLGMSLWTFAQYYRTLSASELEARAGLDKIIDTFRAAYYASGFKENETANRQNFLSTIVSNATNKNEINRGAFAFVSIADSARAADKVASLELGFGDGTKISRESKRLYEQTLPLEERRKFRAKTVEDQVEAAKRDAENARSESRPETATAEPAATTAQTKRSTKEAEKLGLKSGDVKSLRAALTSIADDATQPQHLRNLAKFLADSNAVGAIRSFNVITDPEGPAGSFDPRTGEMSINLARPNTRGVADVVAHELTHALADGYLSKKWPAGSPEAKIVDGLRATYEEARSAVQKLLKEKNLKTLRNELLPKMAAQLTALTSLRKKRKALHKAKLRGTSLAAAQYAPSLSQDEVDQMYFNMARDTHGIHAFEEQIDDFAYALALDPVTGDPLMKGLAGQPFNNANGISKEFLTHALTDAKFQMLLNTMNQPAGADTFLTRAWSAVEKMLRIKHPQPASRVDAMYTDLAELFGDTHVVDAMEAPSAPPVILGPIMAPLRTSAENIEAAIRPWATKAGIGVLAPIEVEVLPADYSPATAPDSETKPENTNESETSTSEETPTIPPGPERQEGSDGQEGLLTADDQAARVNSRAASPIVTGENGVANLAVPADMLRRMSGGNVTDADNALLDEAAQEIAAFREHAFWSLEPYGRVNSRAAAPIDTFTLTDAPDWVVKTLTSGGLYAGLDKPALESVMSFNHEQLKTQPKAWANAASTRERTAMTWHYNKVVKKLIARNKPSEQSELAFAQSMLRRLNGTDNYSGKQPGEIYGMTTSFSPTDARLLEVLADTGIRKRSRVAGVDAVFTPAAQRVDADFYELTALMQSVIDTSVSTPANPDSTMWMVAVSPDSSFPKLAQRLKQFGYSDAAVAALTAFRSKIQSRYPTVSATALGNITGMTQLMDDVSRLQTLHRGLAILPPDKQLKRLSEIYSIVEQHGSWIKPMDLAKNKDADSIVLAMGGDAAQQRTAAMQERFLGILGRAAKLVPDSAPLKFLGAGSEAFSFLDKSQGLVYKLMFPRFMSDSVGFGLDMGAVPGKNRRALFDVYHENPLGRSPLRSMLLEEHTQVPGLVDHEIVGITESGALLAVQRAVEGDIYEEDSQQAIFDEWQLQHGAAEFDASSMNAQLLPASLKSAVLTKDALGNYRAVFDIRSANVNVENNAFLPYDAMVTPPLPDEVLQSKIIEDAKDEVDQRVHSRASSSVVESGMRVLLRMRKGNFALKQPSSRPNDVLNTVWGPLKNLTRYGGFGKLAHPTVMELRAKEQESLLLASRTLEAVERAIKRSADPDTVRELANAVIGSQDNLYDVPMHDAAMKAWRKARSEVLKEWTKAQRQAEAVGKTTKAGTQILQDAGVKLMTDMDAANTARDSALDDAAQAGAENYAGYQETAKRELNSIDPEVAKAVDKMRRTIDQFSHQLDKAGAITGRLKSVVSRNMGIYLTRTYQIHDDPAYLDLLMSSDPEMQSRMQQAEQYFRDRRHAQYVAVYKSKNPGASDTLANNFADRRMAASGAEMAAQDLREFLQYHFRMTRGAASTGTLNESILLEKTDLPSPLRALLGQQTNNIAAGAVSIMELGRYDANWEFLTNIHSLLSEAELARINRREELRLREASFTDEERKEFDDLGNVMYFTNNKVEAARHGLELFIPPRKNMAKSTLGPLDGFYGPPALVQAMQDLTPPDRGIITQMLAQFTGIAQANLTVYSWRSQIRNIASNMAMPLAAGHLPVLPPMPGRGFADRWIGKMGRVEDLLGKAADRDEAMTDLVAFYARYGVTGGNASQQVQQDVAKIAGQDYGAAMINVYPAAVARGTLKAVQTFGKAAGKASEVLQNMYAFGDDIYKIMLFERELAAYIDSFGIVVDDAGGFTLTDAQATEIIDAFGANGRVTPVMRKQIGSSRTALAKEMLLRESAAAVRDSIAYYDTMPELINKFRRSAGIVAAPFLSFRVAMPMAMLGSFRRARFDMQNPATRSKGITRMVAMAAGFGAYTWALKTILKGLYLAASAVGGGDEDKRKVAAFDFPLWWANKEEFALRHLLGDYYRNRDIAYLGINSNGDPIYVDLSWLNPTSQIRDLIVPIMNPSAWREGQTGPAFRESLSRLAEPFITPQILVDAFAKTSMKDDLEASFDTKLEAFGKGVLSAVGMALTPGTVSDVVKTGKAIGTQRQNEEIISSVFGIKVKTVDVAEQLNRDLKAGAQMNIDAAKSVRALKNKDIPPDVQDAYDETMALRARVFQQMSDKYQAAALFIGPDAALKVLRKGDHGLGGTSIKDIERGTLSPYKPSEVTLDAMRRMDRKHGTDRTEKVLEAIRKQESKPLMPL